MEVLTLGGKQYVKASKAARELGYATDYVGQLCRKGAVDAHLVGRTWYVNQEELGTHRVEKKRISREKARVYARKALEEARSVKVKQTTNTAQNVVIRYEKDEDTLLPPVKKVHVVREEQPVVREMNDDSPSYEILNKDKKILMAGTIPVYDIDEQVELTDETVLTPKLIRKRKEDIKGKSVRPTALREQVHVIEEKKPEATSFANRLLEHEVIVEDGSGEEEEEGKKGTVTLRVETETDTEQDQNPDAATNQREEVAPLRKRAPSSLLPSIAFLILISIGSALSLSLYEHISYVQGADYARSYSLSIPDISKIEINI